MARQANAPLPAWVRDTCSDPLKCALWAASLVAFIWMALNNDSHHDLESFCISGSPSMLTEGWLNLRLYYSSMDIAVFTGAVGLMLVAMMLPALQGPLAHLWRQSSPYQRGPAVTAFLLGYFCVWLAGSALLLIVALLLGSFTGSQLVAGLLALIGAGLLAASALREEASYFYTPTTLAQADVPAGRGVADSAAPRRTAAGCRPAAR